MSTLSRTLTPVWVNHRARWIALGAVIVLVVAGVGSYLVFGGGSSTAAAGATTTTQAVSTGTIRQTVAASGTLAPAADDTLDFSSSGVVTSVSATVGQTVSQGQQLATIDSASLAATVAQDNATVAEDQAKVDDDTDATAAQLAADQAALTAAQNALSSARTALAGATLTSPINGVVASVGLTVGQQVSGSGSGGTGSGSTGSGGTGSGGTGSTGSGGTGSGSTGTGSTASSSSSSSSSSGIEVISTNSWVVNATVDATSVGLIKTGEEAQLTITGATDTSYGTISTIAVLPSSSGETASYPVVIAVTGSPSGLRDGEAVTASLIYKQLTDVLTVPTTALHRNSDGSEYVNKVVNGSVQQAAVQVGVSSGAETQITSGLAAGDVIQVQVIRPGAGTGGGSSTRTGNFGGGTGRFGGAGGAGFGGAGAGAGGAGGAGGVGG
jgi:multidrug efflux pump subunit AcrA (membrane-fusion protein)